ncbi:hypothetical protein [Shinella zoogloeoides]|uniref:hypothetical protein n=1 Tax=Shinella zoogloeoides TaxID=352475 RepID=UPI00299F0CD4|nr:hypothetical protein [Shinella zoogloeoides]WPE24135.1 hypothetical protein ShzoTeo12_53550 [Shinella zoogloeoides]
MVWVGARDIPERVMRDEAEMNEFTVGQGGRVEKCVAPASPAGAGNASRRARRLAEIGN